MQDAEDTISAGIDLEINQLFHEVTVSILRIIATEPVEMLKLKVVSTFLLQFFPLIFCIHRG